MKLYGECVGDVWSLVLEVGKGTVGLYLEGHWLGLGVVVWGLRSYPGVFC